MRGRGLGCTGPRGRGWLRASADRRSHRPWPLRPHSCPPRLRGAGFPGLSASRPLDVSVPLSLHFRGFVFLSAAALSPASVSPASVTSQALVPETRGPASAPPQPGERRGNRGPTQVSGPGRLGSRKVGQSGCGDEFAAPSGLRTSSLGRMLLGQSHPVG